MVLVVSAPPPTGFFSETTATSTDVTVDARVVVGGGSSDEHYVVLDEMGSTYARRRKRIFPDTKWQRHFVYVCLPSFQCYMTTSYKLRLPDHRNLSANRGEGGGNGRAAAVGFG